MIKLLINLFSKGNKVGNVKTSRAFDSNPLEKNLKVYLQEKITNNLDSKIILSRNSSLYRGQSAENIIQGSSFWSEVKKIAKGHAKPYLVTASPSDNLTFIEIKGFVDCIIGKFSDCQELSNYSSVCKMLYNLSKNGFFDDFEGIHGVIDTTASSAEGHEKVFVFSEKSICQIESIKIS